ncbi:MAG: GNAT family N-acetyltransferase [Treponema sp.]|nr:GNAT family N-acetyltransferase [Treponema sp.]
MNIKRIKNYFHCDGLTIKRIYPKRDFLSFEELTVLYINNKDHLFFWHGGLPEFDFKGPDDYVNYLEKYDLMCYVIKISGKIIGFVGITKLFMDFFKNKYRYITYWINKNYAGQGIMQKAITSIEESICINTDYLKADVYTENKASIKLLEKLKFNRGINLLGSSLDNTEMPYIAYKKLLKGQVA